MVDGYQIVYTWLNGVQTSGYERFLDDAIHYATLGAIHEQDELYCVYVVDNATGEVIWEW